MLDPSRNSTGATVVAPYSPRARNDATVSFPVVREELRTVHPETFTILTIPDLLDGPGPARWVAEESEPPQRIPRSLLE